MENVAAKNTNANVMDEVISEETAQAVSNSMAGVWIWVNFIVMFLALVCTGILVAWPLVAKLAAMYTEM